MADNASASSLGDVVEQSTDAARSLADLCRPAGRSVATAESLTGGKVASFLAASPAAAEWFRGGIVAYADDVKHDLLGAPPGPVVSADCAVAMATAARRLLGADLAVAVTGAGGPEPQDGQPVGTVYFGIVNGGDTDVQHLLLDGDPEEIVARTTLHALHLLCASATEASR